MGSIALIDSTKGERLPVKPAYGSTCDGCGWCCAAEPCGVAREHILAHPDEGPCLALEHEAGRFVCGMIRRPGHYMGLPHDWTDGVLGAGRGCDADDAEPAGAVS